MTSKISVEEAFADTPTFRNQLKASENSVNNVDVIIKKIVHTTSSLCDISRSYAEKHTTLLTDLEEYLKMPAACDSESLSTIPVLLQALQEIEGHRAYLHRHFKDVFVDSLMKFQHDDIGSLKKLSREYQQLSNQHETVLARYMAKKPGSPVEEGTAEVEEARKLLHRKSVEYSVKLNAFQEKRQFEIPEQTVSLVCAQMTFFHQAYDVLRDLDHSVKMMTSTFQHSRSEFEKISTTSEIEKFLEGTTPAIYNPISKELPPPMHRMVPEVIKGGFLFKKGSGKMRTVWNRRYFELKEDGKLHYYSDTKEDSQTTLDLRICMVRESPADRKYCFEIVSPSKQHILQAESEAEMNQWITLLKAAISGAIIHMATASTPNPRISVAAAEQTSRELIKQLREIPGNEKCAECGSTEAIEWCSTNLGILFCLKCSGPHRGLGRHVSKVRSLVLDTMDAETMALMKELGNSKVNALFEYSSVEDIQKPKPDSDTSTREKWCIAKYSNQRMLEPRESSQPIHLEIVQAAKQCDIMATYNCLIRGVDVNEVDLQKKTILHHAVAGGDRVIVELLFQWNADINAQDENGKTPLHIAVECDNSEMAALLFAKRQMNICLKDNQDRTPMDMAIELDHPNIVSVLKRKSSFKEQPNPTHIDDAYGANPSLPNKYGWTPLHTASYNGHLEVIQSLLKIASVKPTVNNATVFGFSPLMLAIQQSHYEVTWFFLKIASGMEYLGGVGAAGRVNVNRVVVPVTTSVPSATTTNSNLNSNNSSSSSNTRNIKNSKLQLQVGIGYTPLMISCLNCDVDSTVLLLEYGAEVNAQCKLNGWTAIMYAIVGEIKKRGHGLAQNVENKDELKSGNGGSNFNTLDRRLAVIKLLLEFGADPGLMNWESKSAMDLAVDLGEYDLLDVSTLGLGVDMSMPTDKKTNSVGISNKYEEKDLPTCGCFDGFKCLWDRNPQTRISPLQDTKVNYEITNFPRSQTRKARLFLESTDDIGQAESTSNTFSRPHQQPKLPQIVEQTDW